MNFPQTQKTGELAEIDVERLFTSWGWSVGRDRIDTGYDLFVTPHRQEYRGACFLVQVKGTLERKKSVSAQVSKKRLQEYSRNLLPVIIIRSTRDGELYWVHAQSWMCVNHQKATGNGSTRVVFPCDQKVCDRISFELSLKKIILRTFPQAFTPDISNEISLFNAFDSRLGVRLVRSEGISCYEIYATSEPVTGTMTVNPSKSTENFNRLQEVFDYGLPRSIDVDGLSLTGSPLFDAFIPNQQKGRLSITPCNASTARVHIIPGERYTVTSSELILEVEVFSGARGYIYTNERLPSLFSIAVRFDIRDGRVTPSSSYELRVPTISGSPIKSVAELGQIIHWAEELASRRAFTIQITQEGRNLVLPMPRTGLEDLLEFSSLILLVCKTHLISRATDSNFAFQNEISFDSQDRSEINFCYALLKGESRMLRVESVEFEPSTDLILDSGTSLVMTTTLEVRLKNQMLCRIPTKIEFEGFELHDLSDSSRKRLVNLGSGVAWASYSSVVTDTIYAKHKAE